MHADIEREPLHQTEGLGDICEAVVDAEGHGASLGLLERAYSVRQELRNLAIDDYLAVGVEKTGSVVRCASILELKQVCSLQLTVHLPIFG